MFWHSTAHILGEAMERVYGGCLCYGPPIENGFYYDMFIEDKQVSLLMWNFASAGSENHINCVCFQHECMSVEHSFWKIILYCIISWFDS